MGSCEVTLILFQVTVSVTFISYFILSSMFHLLTQPQFSIFSVKIIRRVGPVILVERRYYTDKLTNQMNKRAEWQNKHERKSAQLVRV